MKPYPPLPPRREEPVSRSGVLFLLTGLFVLPLAICFLCDFLLHGRLTWFYYVCGGLLLAYVVLVLPLWFARPNPVIFVPADFAAAALFLLLVDLRTFPAPEPRIELDWANAHPEEFIRRFDADGLTLFELRRRP